ncbi:MAG: hypothetical protein EOP04_10255 [Proteobacteria bacterium]|nr:MAG: hypothetical protein EOP04_10255 [Pseudomonadota bacterium]
MHDDELYALMKKETPYLPDSGFSERILESLPVRRRFRAQVITSSFVVSIFLAFGVWMANDGFHNMSAIYSPLAWGAAAIAFWSFIALFAFVSVDEGVFEI